MSIGELRPSEPFRGVDRLGRAPRSARPQIAEKVEVQEALPPAGVLGAEPLSRYTLTARSAG